MSARGRQVAGTLYVLASSVCFATMAIFARMAYAAGVDVPTLLFLRFSSAAVLMWGLLLAKGLRPPRGRGLVMTLAMGAVGYAGQAFAFFTALQYASAGLVALLLYTYPAIVAILSRLVFRHPLTRLQVVAVGIALAGSVLVIGKAVDGQPLGIFFGLLAAFVYSVYILTGSRFPADVTPTASTTIITSAAAATYACVVALHGFHPPATAAGWGGHPGDIRGLHGPGHPVLLRRPRPDRPREGLHHLHHRAGLHGDPGGDPARGDRHPGADPGWRPDRRRGTAPGSGGRRGLEVVTKPPWRGDEPRRDAPQGKARRAMQGHLKGFDAAGRPPGHVPPMDHRPHCGLFPRPRAADMGPWLVAAGTPALASIACQERSPVGCVIAAVSCCVRLRGDRSTIPCVAFLA